MTAIMNQRAMKGWKAWGEGRGKEIRELKHLCKLVFSPFTVNQ